MKKIFDSHLGGLEINLFDIWHFLYLFLIIGGTILTAFLLKNKNDKVKKRYVNGLIISAVVVYALDFFCMPFSINHISIDKLPFHICTSISVIACIAHFSKRLNWLKTPSVLLSITASLMYITYPGSALGNISPISYTVVQTFLFHGLLFAYGFISISTGETKINIKNCWKDLILICGIAVWASIGNSLYQGIPSEGSHYDWFFLTGSTFPFVPKWLMPFVAITAVFGVLLCVYGIYYLVNYIYLKIKNKKDLNNNSKSNKIEKNNEEKNN